MTKIERILLELVRVGMGWSDCNEELLDGHCAMSEADWKVLVNLAGRHGVGVICTDAVEHLKGRIKISRMELMSLIAIRMQAENNIRQKAKTIQSLTHLLGTEGVKVLVLKGPALSLLYPDPMLRQFGDIDIYLGDDYEKGNEILLANGGVNAGMYYRHSEINFHGTMVENHCWLSDQGIEKTDDLEQIFREYADECLKTGKVGDTIFPNATFNGLFLAWHASSHFMFDGITLRHVLDWAMFLVHQSKEADIEVIRQTKARFVYGRFADILTALSVDYLKIPLDSVAPELVEDARRCDAALVRRVMDYILEGSVRKHSVNIIVERLELVKHSFRNRWKFSEVYQISYLTILKRKVFAILRLKVRG